MAWWIKRKWAKSEMALVRQHYKKGTYSAEKISAMLDNRTRAAVVGKANRMGLCQPIEEIRRNMEPRDQARPKPSMPVFKFLEKEIPW